MFIIEHDKNYGIDKRTGWSITENGIVIVELEKSLIKALFLWVTKR